jgi:predicted AlkP superfamily pyrophosphatase or phosphodiesterase
MIKALKDAGIYDSTLFIVTAKHGQSPINPVKTNKPMPAPCSSKR